MSDDLGQTTETEFLRRDVGRRDAVAKLLGLSAVGAYLAACDSDITAPTVCDEREQQEPPECPPVTVEECDFFAEVPPGFHEKVGSVYFPDCRNIAVRVYDASTGNTLGTFRNEGWDGDDSVITNHTQDLCGRIRGPGGYNPNDEQPDNSIRGYTMQFGVRGDVGGREVDGIVNLNINIKGGKEYFVDPEGDGTAVSNFDKLEATVLQPKEWQDRPVVGFEIEYFGQTGDTRGGGFAVVQGPFTAPVSALEEQAIYKDRSGMRLEATIKENCRQVEVGP